MKEKIEFEDALTDGDWGLIISKDGELKGLFIPDGEDEDDVPEVILSICKKYWGIDPNKEVPLH